MENVDKKTKKKRYFCKKCNVICVMNKDKKPICFLCKSSSDLEDYTHVITQDEFFSRMNKDRF